MQIAEKLKELRNNKGYSTKDVAEELKKYNITLSHNTIYGYENGYSVPNADLFICLCKIYGVTDYKIFFDDEISEKAKTPYELLNDIGKAKADEYIKDLSFNPQYTSGDRDIAGDIAGELKQESCINSPITSTK